MIQKVNWSGSIDVIDQTINNETLFNRYFTEHGKASSDMTYDIFQIMMNDPSGRVAGVQASFLNKTYRDLIERMEMTNYVPPFMQYPRYERCIDVSINGYNVPWLMLKTSVRKAIIEDILDNGSTSGTVECEMTDREMSRFCA